MSGVDEVALSADALCRVFDNVEVVLGASLQVGRGESVAIMGPSGSGKTTLLQMLGLLDKPTSGKLYIGGMDAWSLPAHGQDWVRLVRLGFVFQQHNLLAHLSARDNVALPAWRRGVPRRAALADAEELLCRFDLACRAGTLASRLSMGESQRVAIARALINRPELVLADEPTASLDAESASSVLTALEELRRSGAALLVVTHDPGVASRMSRIVTMSCGRLTQAPVAQTLTPAAAARGPSRYQP